MKNLYSLITLIVFSAVPLTTFAQDSDLVLEEVVVTATKREENVQDIAQTVNAVSGAQLDNYQIRDLSELAQLVSGFNLLKLIQEDSKSLLGAKSLILMVVTNSQFKAMWMKSP